MGREPRHITYGESTLRSLADGLDPLAADRRKELFVAALKLGSLVAAGEILYGRARQFLMDVARRLALPLSDAEKNIRNGLTRGMRSPRTASVWGTIKDRTDGSMYWVNWWDSVTLDTTTFRGTKGSTLLKLFAGFALNGVAIGSRDMWFGVRQASESSGLSTNTAYHLLTKGGAAEATGYLKAIKRPRPSEMKATTWRPMMKRTSAGNRDTQMHRSAELNLLVSRISTFDDGGTVKQLAGANTLSANAWRIHSLLTTDEEFTVKQLATAIGITTSTVRTILKLLAGVGLATRVDRFTWTGTTTDVSTVPSDDGVDHGAVRRERHQAEREHHRAAIEARRQYETKVPILVVIVTDAGEVFDERTGELIQPQDAGRTAA